jgi:hypothetical protein
MTPSAPAKRAAEPSFTTGGALMSDAREPNADKMPETDQLQEPSTEKDPGEEPKDAEVEPEEVDHEAVGIGVIDAPEPGAPKESNE